jgi:hydroxymethylglutaryl-CoA synthase
MSGLLAYGAYVPFHRLRRSEISDALGEGPGKGTRSVASYDEDATSMGVEAARRALKSAPTSHPKRLLFATTNPPYLDKTNANAIHAALSLDPSALAIDVIGSVRSGVGAFLLAAESVTPTLAVLADIRTGLPGGSDEREGGDAAAAFLFGDGPVIAEILGQQSFTEEFLDRWRLPGALASRVWEDRFGEFAYVPLADSVFSDVLKQVGLTTDDVDVLVVAGTHDRSVRAFARGSGVARLGDDLSSKVGNAGTAQPGLLLAAALDRAQPDQTIALVVLADGATAVVLRTTDNLTAYQASNGPDDFTVDAQISNGDESLRYTTFLSWRGFLTREPPRRPDLIPPAGPPSLRTAAYKFGFVGSRCSECGTVHLPSVRVCVECKALDQMEPIHMADLHGSVATFTIDHLAFSPSPPVVAAVVDFDGGGRFSCELTDVDPAEVAIGDRVEMTFRRLFTAGGIHNYFWKARPVGRRAATATPNTTET